jgi:nucleoside-specific outer membrane channel protein Tsx
MEEIYDENSPQDAVFDAVMRLSDAIAELQSYQEYINWKMRNEEAQRIAKQKSRAIRRKNRSCENPSYAYHNLMWHNPGRAVVVNSLK